MIKTNANTAELSNNTDALWADAERKAGFRPGAAPRPIRRVTIQRGPVVSSPADIVAFLNRVKAQP